MAITEGDDPYLWLEDVESDRALAWVRERNAHAEAQLAGDEAFAQLSKQILEILDSDERIPEVVKAGEWYYNFWRDADHERGIWRRTTLASYRTDQPDWDVLLDLDALNEREGTNWVWHGAKVLRTGPRAYELALVNLSRGGADADVTREFDLTTRTFVDGGFYRPEGRGDVSWIDADTVYLAADTGSGSMTESGFPRIARRWKRGESYTDAEIVYEGEQGDLMVIAHRDRTPGYERDWVSRATSFYTSEDRLLDADGSLTRIDIPDSAELSVKRDIMLVELRDDWVISDRTHTAGALLGIGFDAFLSGDREFATVFEPTATTSLGGYVWTASRLVLTVLDDVRYRVEIVDPANWSRQSLSNVPDLASVGVRPLDPDESDLVWVTTTSFLSPPTLSIADVGDPSADLDSLKSTPAFFDASTAVAEQHFVRSADGTRIPYFVVRPRDLAYDGSAPTLLTGYGGFEIARTPEYSGAVGRAWIEQGGVHVVANIRGGGEYGPAWHQAALRENRHRAYEDFAAVARNLVERGITSPQHLGAMGGSNGGLLTGNMLTGYPELFAAIVIRVPLLDMRRYHQLLAGALWVAEYGDPDTSDWEYLKTYSPYHRFDPEATYPPVLLTTSTRDDRVHPGHARKMAALMLQHDKDVTYWENIEGGHGGAATNAQVAHMAAMAYRFLWHKL